MKNEMEYIPFEDEVIGEYQPVNYGSELLSAVFMVLAIVAFISLIYVLHG